jgi:CelD/BcsL family acetyltransferase involved in cellulose biosynthesis
MVLVRNQVEVMADAIVAQAVLARDLSAELIGETQELAAQASEPNVFHEGWFLAPALRHLAAVDTVQLIEVRCSRRDLIGLMPLTIVPNYGRMPIPHVSNWAHYQCFMGTPLVRAGDEVAFWLALIAWLDRSKWAVGLLSLRGLLEGGPVHKALVQAAEQLGRPCATVHRYERAALASDLSPEAYLEANVRAKKRKELRRLSNRLAEIGTVTFSLLSDSASITHWCDEFLALEAAGWKGDYGAALGNSDSTTAFFRDVIRGGFAAGRLDFQKLALDGRSIAMLVNFKTPPGSWSFKIAYDEALARYSPGVLIELENLPRVLNDPTLMWMDSCAVQDHPMINSLWGERRSIIQVSLPLSGSLRMLTYKLCRGAEATSAWLRSARNSNAE